MAQVNKRLLELVYGVIDNEARRLIQVFRLT